MPEVQSDMGISLGLLNTAISLTGLFSGMFVVAAGGISDRIGRKKIATIGLVLNIIGSLCLIFAQGTVLLIIGRVIQGFSAACIMPATIALVKTYFDGADRQRALSYWSFGSWGGGGIMFVCWRFNCYNFGMALYLRFFYHFHFAIYVFD